MNENRSAHQRYRQAALAEFQGRSAQARVNRGSSTGTSYRALDEKVKCSICRKPTPITYPHHTSYDPPKVIWVCASCHAKIPTPSGSKWSCTFCDAQFEFPTALASHVRHHHRDLKLVRARFGIPEANWNRFRGVCWNYNVSPNMFFNRIVEWVLDMSCICSDLEMAKFFEIIRGKLVNLIWLGMNQAASTLAQLTPNPIQIKLTQIGGKRKPSR